MLADIILAVTMLTVDGTTSYTIPMSSVAACETARMKLITAIPDPKVKYLRVVIAFCINPQTGEIKI